MKTVTMNDDCMSACMFVYVCEPEKETKRRYIVSNSVSESVHNNKCVCLSEHMCMSMLFMCVWVCVYLCLSVSNLVGFARQGL